MKNEIEKYIIEFQGKIDDENIRVLKNSIISKSNEEKTKNIFVSLKLFVNEKNLKIIGFIINEIEKLSIKIGVSIDFIDYTEELFLLLKEASQDTGINLYKNKDIALLFIDKDAFSTDIKILVYDENEVNSKKIYFYLCKYGYSIVRALDMKEFLTGTKNDSFDIIVSRSMLNKRVIKSEINNKLSLSKKLIINLPTFMNKASDTLFSFTGLEAQKISHSIKKFDTNLDTDCISSVMTFSGDIEGYFTLLFPKNIAVIALEALLGEKVAADDVDTLKDGIGEFCNIITGAAKTEFDTKNIKVIFELPKTYTSLIATQKHIGKNNGVWMDMQLSGKPFYMFITK